MSDKGPIEDGYHLGTQFSLARFLGQDRLMGRFQSASGLSRREIHAMAAGHPSRKALVRIKETTGFVGTPSHWSVKIA